MTLTRVVQYGESKSIDGGTLSIVNGEKIEKIQMSVDAGGELMNINNETLAVCFSKQHEDRLLQFSEELIGSEYFLAANSSKVKYGQYEYKVNKKPKLFVKFSEEFNRDRTIEKEERRTVQ